MATNPNRNNSPESNGQPTPDDAESRLRTACQQKTNEYGIKYTQKKGQHQKRISKQNKRAWVYEQTKHIADNPASARALALDWLWKDANRQSRASRTRGLSVFRKVAKEMIRPGFGFLLTELIEDAKVKGYEVTVDYETGESVALGYMTQRDMIDAKEALKKENKRHNTAFTQTIRGMGFLIEHWTPDGNIVSTARNIDATRLQPA